MKRGRLFDEGTKNHNTKGDVRREAKLVEGAANAQAP